MKKMIFALTVLMLVAPAWATNVTITAVPVGGTDVEIWYETDDSLPRAFGLNISVDSGRTIEGCSAEFVGQCDAVGQGYGIFPGTIDINDDTGDVDSNGTPVAPNDAPGAEGTGLGTSEIVVELGSLYTGANTPDVCGVICTITLSDGDCNVSIAGNAARTGTASPEGVGVVLEDPCEAPGSVVFTGTYVGPSGCMMPEHPDYANWLYWNKPDCWCYARQCRGDIDGLKLGPYWVSLNDLALFKLAIGKMEFQLPPDGECSDLDHQKLGPYWVSLNDLAIFKQYIGKMEFQIPECDDTYINEWIVP